MISCCSYAVSALHQSIALHSCSLVILPLLTAGCINGVTDWCKSKQNLMDVLLQRSKELSFPHPDKKNSPFIHIVFHTSLGLN